MGTLKIGPRHVKKIGLVQQHAGTRVVDVQKTLQIGERVGCSQRFHSGVGQRNAIALRQRKNQFRLQRALDVDVQLCLGNAPGQGNGCVGGCMDVRLCHEVLFCVWGCQIDHIEKARADWVNHVRKKKARQAGL